MGGSPVRFVIRTALGGLFQTGYLFAELITTAVLPLAGILYLVLLDANKTRLTAPLSFLRGIRWPWALAALLVVIYAGSALLASATGMSTIIHRVKNVFFFKQMEFFFKLNKV